MATSRTTCDQRQSPAEVRAAFRVLLVEPSGPIRAILRRILRELTRCQVVEATNGHAALARFLDGQFDLVITDRQLAVLDGLSLSKEIRHRSPKIPILMIASKSAREEILEAVHAGVSDYVIKPFDRATIKQKLAHWATAFS